MTFPTFVELIRTLRLDFLLYDCISRSRGSQFTKETGDETIGASPPLALTLRLSIISAGGNEALDMQSDHKLSLSSGSPREQVSEGGESQPESIEHARPTSDLRQQGSFPEAHQLPAEDTNPAAQGPPADATPKPPKTPPPRRAIRSASVSPDTTRKKGSPPSKVWDYYIRDFAPVLEGRKSWGLGHKCKICGEVVYRQGSRVKQLRKHLRKKHTEEHGEFLSKEVPRWLPNALGDSSTESLAQPFKTAVPSNECIGNKEDDDVFV